jgi:hypothetical protein
MSNDQSYYTVRLNTKGAFTIRAVISVIKGLG